MVQKLLSMKPPLNLETSIHTSLKATTLAPTSSITDATNAFYQQPTPRDTPRP